MEDTEDLSEKYTDVMQERMGSAVLTYRHEDGTNFSRILDDLIVGSCLQQPTDVDRSVVKWCECRAWLLKGWQTQGGLQLEMGL